MARLTDLVSALPGVGPKTAARLHRLDIRRVVDILSHFPIRHDDLRTITPIAKLSVGQPSVIRGQIQLIATRRSRRRRMALTEALIEDDSGSVRAVWFNQPYLATSFPAGSEVFLAGRLTQSEYGIQLTSPTIERVRARQLLAGRLLPVYRATAGLNQRQLRDLAESALPAAQRIPDWLPESIRRSEKLVDVSRAIREIHFPASIRRLEEARARLSFNELFLFVLSQLLEDQRRAERPAPTITFNEAAARTFVAGLPFQLTTDQRRAAWSILRDLERPIAMRRLLEGDVGSGKTVVAAMAARMAAEHGIQTAVLVPTEILAQQHERTMRRLLSPTISVGRLTSHTAAYGDAGSVPKRQLCQRLADGRLPIVIGTQALLSKSITFKNLGLVVIDEQHRFGVHQRHQLLNARSDRQPHLLSMTATPIPRTLALALYGNLTVSQLRQRPTGRMEIATKLIDESQLEQAESDISVHVNRGQQAYVVCPLIEETDELGVAAATQEFERLRKSSFKRLRIGLLHGQLPSAAKERLLRDFSDGHIDVLVSTPVVEVGIDVPNATVMVIEGAERFGLAQLHQLRGRIGRGSIGSTCYLVSSQPSIATRQRLEAVVQSQDGFALAETDLRSRGPGDMYGIRQSGLPAFSIATLQDVALLRRARSAAESLLANDPALEQSPLVKKKIAGLERSRHRE